MAFIPGSIAKDGGNSTNYDFGFQPIDWSDAIAKRHDMDYAKATETGGVYAGFLEDTRTLQTDKDMIARVKDLLGNISNPFKKNGVDGVETPFRTSTSGEMEASLNGQLIVIGAVATYKKWKIDSKYTNKDTYSKLRDEFKKYDGLIAGIIDLINPGK